MMFVLGVIFFLIFIFKIQILGFERRNKKCKLWYIYFTFIVAEITSLLGVYVYFCECLGLSFSMTMQLMLLLVIVFLECIVFLVVGIIFYIKQKKVIKKEEKNGIKNKFLFFKIILTFISVWGIIFLVLSIPKIFKSDVEKYTENYALDYMNNKYGDGDFKVINIAKEYSSDDGTFSGEEDHSGFIVYLKSSYVKDVIRLHLDGITKDTLNVSYDSLIRDYYDLEWDEVNEFRQQLEDKKIEIVNREFNKKFNLTIDVDCYSYEIPEDYGHIPNVEELVDLITKFWTSYINVDIKEKNLSYDERLDYLKRLAQFSIEYFDTDEEINIYYTWNGMYSYWNGKKDYIKIKDDIVIIKINEEENIFTKEDIEKNID